MAELWANFRVSKEDVAADMKAVSSEIEKSTKGIGKDYKGIKFGSMATDFSKAIGKGVTDSKKHLDWFNSAAKKGMSDAFKSSSASSKWFGDAVKKGTVDAFRASNNQMQGPDLSGSMRRKANYGAPATKVNWKQVLIGLGLGFSNPYVGTRVLNDELGKLNGGKGGGLFGKGGIVGFSEIFSAFKSFKIAVSVFSEGVRRAIDKGHEIYTQSAMQGLSTKFFTSRQSVAGMLGVSGDPNQIFRFGAAVKELGERSAWASNLMSINSRTMFNTSINFKVLKLDLEAMFSVIADKLSPAIDTAVKLIDMMVRAITNWITIMTITAIMTGNKIISDAIDLLKKIDKNGDVSSQLVTSAHQLRASTWEHMGLVIGGGANTTNDLIRKSNGFLQTIAELMKGKAQKGNNRFGLDPSVSNP